MKPREYGGVIDFESVNDSPIVTPEAAKSVAWGFSNQEIYQLLNNDLEIGMHFREHVVQGNIGSGVIITEKNPDYILRDFRLVYKTKPGKRYERKLITVGKNTVQVFEYQIHGDFYIVDNFGDQDYMPVFELVIVDLDAVRLVHLRHYP